MFRVIFKPSTISEGILCCVNIIYIRVHLELVLFDLRTKGVVVHRGGDMTTCKEYYIFGYICFVGSICHPQHVESVTWYNMWARVVGSFLF